MTTESTAPVVGTLVVPHKPIRSELFVSRARAAMVFLLPFMNGHLKVFTERIMDRIIAVGTGVDNGDDG